MIDETAEQKLRAILPDSCNDGINGFQPFCRFLGVCVQAQRIGMRHVVDTTG